MEANKAAEKAGEGNKERLKRGKKAAAGATRGKVERMTGGMHSEDVDTGR